MVCAVPAERISSANADTWYCPFFIHKKPEAGLPAFFIVAHECQSLGLRLRPMGAGRHDTYFVNQGVGIYRRLRLNYRYTGEASFAGGVGALLDHQLPPFKRVNARLQ